MIYSINEFFCKFSALCFSNFLTFIIFTLIGFLILKFFIQKLSNVSVLLYLLFIITIYTGGIVLSVLPQKEDVTSSKVIDSFYLGIIAFALLVALIIKVIIDVYELTGKDVKKKSITKKTVVKEIENIEDKEEKEIKEEKKKETPKKTVKKTVRKTNNKKTK